MSTVRVTQTDCGASSGRLDRWQRYSMCLIPWARIDGKASKVRFVGVVKQVNRRVANARRDVLESFTVEHRLHECFCQWFAAWNRGSRLFWMGCKMRQDSHRHRQVGIMFMRNRIVLRLVTESACICWDMRISFFVSCYALGFARVVQRAWATCLYGKSP